MRSNSLSADVINIVTKNNLEKKGAYLTDPSSVEAGARAQTGEKRGTMRNYRLALRFAFIQPTPTNLEVSLFAVGGTTSTS